MRFEPRIFVYIRIIYYVIYYINCKWNSIVYGRGGYVNTIAVCFACLRVVRGETYGEEVATIGLIIGVNVYKFYDI